MSDNSKALSKKDEAAALALYGANDAHTDDLDRDSYSIPRFALIEKLSPELEEGDPAYIEGAKPGMIVNKTMGTVHTALKVIPVYRRRVYLEWVPRAAGGGFAGEHSASEGDKLMTTTERNDKNVDILPNGNELHNTLEFYVLASADDGATWDSGIISMSRTRMSEGKKWNTRISNYTRGGRQITPMAQVYDLTTAKRENPEGVSYVFKAGAAQFLPEAVDDDAAVFGQAQRFLEALQAGTATVDRDAEAATNDTGAGNAGTGGNMADDEDIAF